MRAVVYNRYGPPEVLELTELPKPVPEDNEVLVRVYATTVTAGDWRMRKADPFAARLYNGLFKPRKVKILGFELSGVVEETGKDVKKFKSGDPVFASCGIKFGGYAEFKCFNEKEKIEIKPANITFDEAAAVPIGATTALGFLKKADLRSGQTILIYGTSGSVGTYAVQLAGHFGAFATGVCSSANMELIKSLGSVKVIDYTREDLSDIREKYDVVFDAVGKFPKNLCGKLLKRRGKFITVRSSPKKVKNDLLMIKKLIEEGSLKPVIDRTYTLEQIREAHRYVEGWHKKGNVVIQVIRNSLPKER